MYYYYNLHFFKMKMSQGQLLGHLSRARIRTQVGLTQRPCSKPPWGEELGGKTDSNYASGISSL